MSENEWRLEGVPEGIYVHIGNGDKIFLNRGLRQEAVRFKEAANAALSSLRAERDELKEEVRLCNQRALDVLQLERSLREDKARLDWYELNERANMLPEDRKHAQHCILNAMSDPPSAAFGSTLREAIDAAMKESK